VRGLLLISIRDPSPGLEDSSFTLFGDERAFLNAQWRNSEMLGDAKIILILEQASPS